ncbi:hypothetical protein K438DRAFT_1823645 [Mycena galopus ATCC 62051]|nr:hypothetical protein K438DRAFT_1823645 [Mycena galopus ATCC 62051]
MLVPVVVHVHLSCTPTLLAHPCPSHPRLAHSSHTHAPCTKIHRATEHPRPAHARRTCNTSALVHPHAHPTDPCPCPVSHEPGASSPQPQLTRASYIYTVLSSCLRCPPSLLKLVIAMVHSHQY